VRIVHQVADRKQDLVLHGAHNFREVKRIDPFAQQPIQCRTESGQRGIGIFRRPTTGFNPFDVTVGDYGSPSTTMEEIARQLRNILVGFRFRPALWIWRAGRTKELDQVL
jgi:hypothetical protein